MNFKKKSQMEILGLAIVVILITLAMVFVVRFIAFKTPTDYRKGFVNSELASNMLNTFLKTSSGAECSQLTMTELLQDCGQGGEICCTNCNNDDTSDDVKSCEFVRTKAIYIFGQTFDKWNMKYEFLAYADQNNPRITIGARCTGEKQFKMYPIPIKAGTMYVKLDICT